MHERNSACFRRRSLRELWRTKVWVGRNYRLQNIQLPRPPPTRVAQRRNRSLTRLSGTTHLRAFGATVGELEEACPPKLAQRAKAGPQAAQFAGGHRIRVTPVPIPNTEVKPDTADGTAWETVWESRSLPALFLEREKPDRQRTIGLFPCTPIKNLSA